MMAMEEELLGMLGRPGLGRDAVYLLCVRLMEERLPGGKVEFVEEEAVRITWPGGEESTFFLGNLWSEYSREPEARVEVVERYLESVLGRDREEEVGVRDVVALVKNEDYVRQLGEDGGEVTDHLVGDLWVVYAVDRPQSIVSISVEQRERLALNKAAMRRVARVNLRRLLARVERHGDGEWFLLTTQPETASYVSSLLLLEGIWEVLAAEVAGDLVVGVPSRDVVLVTGSRSAKGLVAVREQVEAIWKVGDHLVSRGLLRRSGESWVVHG